MNKEEAGCRGLGHRYNKRTGGIFKWTRAVEWDLVLLSYGW